ncbi:MAG: RING finger protein [Candidatus Woesearchaeota archaeon]
MEKLPARARCPVCGTDFKGHDYICCGQCNTPHHLDCWEYCEGCATYGCRKQRHGGISKKKALVPENPFRDMEEVQDDLSFAGRSSMFAIMFIAAGLGLGEILVTLAGICFMIASIKALMRKDVMPALCHSLIHLLIGAQSLFIMEDNYAFWVHGARPESRRSALTNSLNLNPPEGPAENLVNPPQENRLITDGKEKKMEDD